MNLLQPTAQLRVKNNILVSVCDAKEALIVRNSVVDILDIKNPDRGALGRADLEVVQEILQIQSTSNQCSSLALGELIEIDFDVREFMVECDPKQTLDYVKFGLAHCVELPRDLLLETVNDLPDYLNPVICAYADAEIANAPHVESVIEFAAQASIPVVLIDTFDKSKGNFFEFISPDYFTKLNTLAFSNGVNLAIAGSLRYPDLKEAIALTPSIIGVRGAACDQQNRRSRITQKSLDDFIKRFDSVIQTCVEN